MLRTIARGITGPFVERLVVGMTESWGDIPTPSDEPYVHAMGPDPDRILLLGGGAVAGAGVTSHEIGIGGFLARQLSTLTGRGVDVDLIGVPGLTAANAIELIDAAEPARFDAVVIMVGVHETLSLTSPSAWDHDIRAIIDRVHDAAPFVAVFIVEIAPLGRLVPLRRLLGPLISRQTATLNAITQRVCRERGAGFIPVSTPARSNPHHFVDAMTYAVWADPISRHMARALNEAVPVPNHYTPDEELRQSALDAMDVLDSPPTAELDAITRVARDLFGVLGAAVNLIDRDRQYMKAATGFERGDRPRNESFCTITVEEGGLLVIGDTTRDPRVSDLPATVEEGIKFYAGYPVEAPNGQRVGTLCLFDTEPRSFTASDASLLRELALRVQRELWKRAEVSARR